MKLVWHLIAFALVLAPLSHGATRKASTDKGNSSTRYLSLKKWAQQKGFIYKYDDRKDVAMLSSKWSTLLFEKHQKRSVVNGVSVWLSHPPTISKDTLYVTERDINSHIGAILSPAKMPKGKRIRTIAISAGHGGKDPGYIIRDQQEKKFTLLLAKELKEILQRAGFKVVSTRDKDIFVPLEEQARVAIAAKADLFINLHFNAHPDVDARGVEVFCLTPAGTFSTNGGRLAERSPGNKLDELNLLLAYQVQKAFVRDMDMVDRGVRRASFVVLRNATMPCILIEGGFMSNPSDAKKIFDSKNRTKMAQSITDGVLAYKKAVER